MDNETPQVINESEQVYDAVRAMCHISTKYPAPVVYSILGNLKSGTGSMLAQALRQVAEGLQRSLKEYDVYEDDGADPAFSADMAYAHMLEAAALAESLGESLNKAQSAIARQGYRD